MNGSSDIEKKDHGTGRAMLAMLAGAAAIGLAFNSVNPLGIRTPRATMPDDPPSAARELYENETVELSLEGPSPAGRTSPAAPGAIYENDTVAAHLEINRAEAVALAAPLMGVRTISWRETKSLLAAGRIVLLDARAAAYYETGHIPGAISFPATGATREEFAAFAAKYAKDTPLVVYCGSEKCPLAAELANILTGSMGYTDVRDMAGGYVEYREAENHPAGGGAK